MRRRWIAVGMAALVAHAAAWGQDSAGPAERAAVAPATERAVALRVVGATVDGGAVVDRGARDGLGIGTVVRLTPRGGAEVTGRVVRVLERRAEVATASGAEVPRGTKGVALVAVDVPAGGTARGVGVDAGPGPGDGLADDALEALRPDRDPSEQPGRWRNLDEDWTPDRPLLSSLRPQRPGQRPTRINGRSWVGWDAILSPSAERSDTFGRVGGELFIENPFGAGGVLNAEGEFLRRTTEVPDEFGFDDEERTNLRVDRLSYAWGGTRFAPDSFEVGRFLQDVAPLGVVDGLQWSRRLQGGDRFGASVGLQPEPDPSFDGTSDLQFAGWYTWSRDATERTSATLAVQKSFHNGASDRNLFILRAHHLPADGWQLQGTAWIDLFGPGDTERDGLALTEAHLDATRRFDANSGVSVSYDHLEFPDLRRDEFVPPTEVSIEEARRDRLALSGWAPIVGGRRVTGRVAAWSDEEDAGGDVELEVESRDLFVDGSRTRLAFFGGQGRFSQQRGARLSYGHGFGSMDWSLAYEVVRDDLEGFEAQNADALQHRVRASTDWTPSVDWSFSLYGEALLQDEDDAWTLGLFLTRSF